MSEAPKGQGYEEVALHAVQIEHGGQSLQRSDGEGPHTVARGHASAETSSPGGADSNLLRLAVEGIDRGKRGREICPGHLDAPAIIIHSAISTPGDDERCSFGEMPPSENGDGMNDDSQTQENVQARAELVQDPGVGISNQETSRFDSPIRIGGEAGDSGGALSGTSFGLCESSSASTVKNVGEFRRPSLECETGVSVGTSLVGAKEVSFKAPTAKIPRISKDSSSPYNFQSNDVSDKKNPCRNVMKNEGKANSLDDQWSESSSTDRLLGDAKPRSQDTGNHGNSSRKASSRPTPSANAQPFDRALPSCGLMPSTSKMSRSYNDLSGRHRAGGTGAADDISFLQDLRSSGKDRAMLEVCGSGAYKQHNRSGSNLNKVGDHGHSAKKHLLPETRTFHGSHNMRSVSADDVRMRSGTDEYVWKDGKVQLKNGVVSHGESVRYVWKDGHVEKITTDSNNEETQVEILETSDDKACNKINPVFICIVLIAFIAVAIILPIYFTS